MPVCILGMYESGTTTVAGWLQSCGVYMGHSHQNGQSTEPDTSPLTIYNDPFHEINQEILAIHSGTWDEPPSLEDNWTDDPAIYPLIHRARGIVTYQSQYPHWGFSDSLSMLTIRLWKQIIPDLKIVLCVRNPDDVAQALSMHQDLTLESKKALGLWKNYHRQFRNTLTASDYLISHYDTYSYDPVSELRRILEYVGVEVSLSAINDVTAGWQRRRKTQQVIVEPEKVTDSVANLYNALSTKSGHVYTAMQNNPFYQVEQLDRAYTENLQALEQEHERTVTALQQELDDLLAQSSEEQTHLKMQIHEQLETAMDELQSQLEERFASELEELKREHQKELEEQAAKFRLEFEEQLAKQSRKQRNSHDKELENQLQRLHDQHEAELQQLQDHQQEMYQRRLYRNLQHFRQLRDIDQAQLQKAEQDLQSEIAHRTNIERKFEYKLLKRWWGFKNWLLPKNSRAGRFYRRYVKASYTSLAKNGPKDFGMRVNRWRKRRGVLVTSNTQRSPVHLSATIHNSYYNFLVHRAEALDYQEHINATEPTLEELIQQAENSGEWATRPLIAIITPTYNTPLAILEETLESVLHQTYSNWEWHIAEASTDSRVWGYLSQQAQNEARLKLHRVEENKGISENTNVALRAIGDADFIAFLDHDDVLAPHALFEVMSAIRHHPDTDVIYSDEDKLSPKNYRKNPFFKSDFSPSTLLCVNQVTHFAVCRASLLATVGLLDSEMDSAQDWDFWLRVSEHTNRFLHVPKVLYHWRMTPQSTAESPENKGNLMAVQGQAIRNHLRRSGRIKPQVEFIPNHPVFRMYPVSSWEQREPRKISIIIPSKDRADYLGRCLDTIFSLTTYPDYEVIVVDTGSQETATSELYQQYEANPRFRVVEYREKFNFSKACNVGAQHADGDLFLFLNNDVEIRQANWLDLMAQWYEYDDVGIVGAKLEYPDGAIQHAGVIIGIGGLASHLFIGQRDQSFSMFGSPSWYRDMLSVTGACLMISRDVFDRVSGFDEDYLLNYSDIALCLDVVEAGYRVVYTPHVTLLHHESISHGRKIPRVDFVRASTQWKKWFEQGDPYFNQNLSYANTTPEFTQQNRPYPDTAIGQNKQLMDRLPMKEIIQLPDDLRN